jgi:hypothetical protein
LILTLSLFFHFFFKKKKKSREFFFLLLLGSKTKEMSYPPFDVKYVKLDNETLRWATVAVAAVLLAICLIWGVIISTKDRFEQDIRATGDGQVANAESIMSQGNYAMRVTIVAFFWIITLVATFLSWYVSALHMQKSNLIGLDVLNVLIFIMLGLSAYFYYKKPAKSGISRMLVAGSLVLEFMSLLVMIISPTTSGSSGQLISSALYIPLLVTTVGLMR